MKQLHDALKQNSLLIDNFLNSYLPESCGLNKRLIEAMRYSTIGSGKKIRGFLVMEAGRILLSNKKKVKDYMFKELLVAASALESSHSYSLIHDDLPSMDNSDYRRGKKSAHKEFDEATAILAGDALQTCSFEMIANPKNIRSPKKRSALTFNLSNSIGFLGMAGGQQADINANKKKISEKDLFWIQDKKTGSLIKCCLIFACILAESSKMEEDSLINYSQNLGLAFQITDDLLDLNGDKKKLGKPTQQDKLNETPNFVTILGENEARKKCKFFSEKAIDSLNIFGKNAKNLVLLARYSIDREF